MYMLNRVATSSGQKSGIFFQKAEKSGKKRGKSGKKAESCFAVFLR
jgi:hypothetical protein